MGYRQLIIARKDLNMGPGKLAAQVSHASMAFLTNYIRNYGRFSDYYYECILTLDKDMFEQWIDGPFTKTVCQAKNKNQLMKAVTIAEELGLKEGEDFFLIKDNCITDLEPEEIDDESVGRTLTCIGFHPLPDETAHAISKKFHLYV